MAFQYWNSGEPITAKALNGMGFTMIQQGVTQTVTSSTTLVNTNITFVPEINSVYYYELFIYYAAGATADFKWNWDAPHALFCRYTISNYEAAAADTGQSEADQLTQPGSQIIFRRPANATEIPAGGTGVASALACAFDRGTFATDGTLDAVTLQFAQENSNALGAELRGDTTMLIQKIG